MTSARDVRKRHLALAEHDLDLTVAGEPLHLGQTLRGDEHLLALAQHADAAQVAHREPVGVGGHEPQTAGLGRDEHAGEDRPQIVFRRGPNHLAQRARERGRVDPHALPLARAEPRVLLGRLQPQRRREPTARDVGLVVDRDRHRARLELAHDLAEQLRDHRDARLVDLGRHPHPVGDLEVGPDELDAVGVGGDPKVGQHRERTRAAGDGPLHRGHGLREGVPLAVELHYRSPVIRVERSRCSSSVLWIVHHGTNLQVSCRSACVPPSPAVPRLAHRGVADGVLVHNSGHIPSCPQRYPQVCRTAFIHRAPCLIRLMSSLTWSNTSSFSASWLRIFSQACITVVWSRPPKTSAIFG